MSASIYLQYTHPAIVWFEKEEDWTCYDTQIKGTTYIIMPWLVRGLLPVCQDVMANTAHHAFMSVPIYHVQEAQAALLRTYGYDVIQYRLSLRAYLDIVCRCKLMDTQRKCWVDFDGNPT